MPPVPDDAISALAVHGAGERIRRHRRLQPGTADVERSQMMRLVEIRSYRLNPGSRPRFDRLFRDQALPLLKRWKIDVVAYGGSPDDDNAAFLIRAFADHKDRSRLEDAFYSSDGWREGPRESILACIETYTDTVLTLDERTVDALRSVGISCQEPGDERLPS